MPWLLITAVVLALVSLGGLLNTSQQIEPDYERSKVVGLGLDAASLVLTVLVLIQIIL